MQARVKSLSSVVAKLERQSPKHPTIFALADLIGIRVIVLYRRDIDRALDVLRREFLIEREEIKGMDAEDDVFGYQSVHAVMCCDVDAGSSDGEAGSDGTRVELQIRTLAQHIWAAASHDLQYKREEGVPKPLRRTIMRVSALLETVDLELDRVLDDREEYAAEAMSSPLDFRLDVDILRKVLDSRLPAANRDDSEPYSRILDQLGAAGIDTVGGLYRLLDDGLDDVLAHDRTITAALAGAKGRAASLRIQGHDPRRIDQGAFYSHAGLIQKVLEQGQKQKPKRRRF